MKTVVIGGTGHIGSFLTKMLTDDGEDVVVVSSGRHVPHTKAPEEKTKYITLRYDEMFADGSLLSLLQAEKTRAVVDILQGDTDGVYNACRAAGVEQLIVCGSVWMFGRAKVVPTPDTMQTECEFKGYHRRFAEMRQGIERAKADGYSLSAVMPPNICGPGKVPLEGMGGRSVEVHKAHQRGDECTLPFPGTNLVGPCDAEDVARGFYCALRNPDAAAGEIFNVGSAYALTAEKFVQAYGDIYGSTIPIKYVSPEVYITEISPEVGANFHFMAHMCPDITKISAKLGYKPAYTPEQTMERAVKWMFDQGIL